MALPCNEAFKTFFPTIFLINTLGADVCNESLPTVQKVTHCPRNFTELQLAVKRKRCDALANIQTCVDPKKFVYHCLVNQQTDGFVEVCAPEWILAGFCGYYDTVLDKIVTNVKKDCTKSAYPCPGVFNSSDTYKYQVCYEVRKKEQGIQIFDEKGQANTSTSTNHVLWILPTLFAVGFFFAFIFAYLKIRKKNFEAGKTKNNSNMNSSNLPQACDDQSKEEDDITEPQNGIDVDIEKQLVENGNQSTPSIRYIRVFRAPYESNAATEEDTSGMEKSVSKRKNTPLTEEEFKKRIAYRQKVEKNREKQRRFKGNTPSSTTGQSNFNSTFQEITTTSTPNKKELKSTLSDSNLRQKRPPCNDKLKHSISYTGDSMKDRTGDGRLSILLEKMSTDTDITAATEGDISEVGEEDVFIKQSENTPSGEEQKSGKKRKRRKRNKGNKGKAKQNWAINYETN